ncbi:serine hydrolase [Congregibacter variabilis]|uniref:Serine hydrolase n=1 Tax=Congregibacter variabilis TaxID=3081200 RepID=A0ABZ0HZW3_9GAMM|nr:serine hydrolase [Congregibacter sp. IMCC43200]
MIKALAMLLLGVPLIAAAATDARDSFTSVTPKNFDSGGDVSLQFHLHAESYLRSTTISRGESRLELELSPSQELEVASVTVDGEEIDFASYVENDALLDSVLVLHGDRIVFEAYPRMKPGQRHFGWSVTKVLTSATLATLVAQGKVNMDDAIEKYLPELRGSAWAGTSVQNIADMASGIDCRDSDGYQDTSTCVYRMEEALGITASTGDTPAFVPLIQGMQRLRPAGERNEYVSANTNVLMLLIERITEQSYAAAVQERIWQRIGAESDALMAISAEGHAYASGGLMARLRDLARFGRVFTDARRFPDIASTMMADLNSGAGINRSDESLKRLALEHGDDLPKRAGWQWDRVWDDGGLYKSGYLGQGLYVDAKRDLVIAWYGTGINYDEDATDMLPVARQLAVSGLFDSSSTNTDLKAVIQNRNHAYEAAFKAQDIPRLLALHTDDVVFMSSHRERVVGLKELEASLTGELSLGSSSLTLTTQEVTRSGELAMELGRYELTLGGDTQNPITDAGDYLVVWQQDAAGQWLIYRDITTSTQASP